MNGIEWTFILGLGIGTGLLIHTILDSLRVILIHILHSRSSRALLRFSGAASRTGAAISRRRNVDPLDQERIPWLGLYGIAGLLASWAYLQTRWLPVLLLALLPVGGRAWLASLRKRRLRRDTWHFLMDLRLRLGLKGSLLTALMELARDGQNPLATLLKDYLRTDREGGLAILSRMASIQ